MNRPSRCSRRVTIGDGGERHHEATRGEHACLEINSEPAGTSAAPPTPSPNPVVALLDLNPNTLHITTAPLADRGITAAAHTGSVLAPLPTDIGVFDSVSTNFVLHCVPGTWAEKGRAFAHIVPVTADDGVTSARPMRATRIESCIRRSLLPIAFEAESHIRLRRAPQVVPDPTQRPRVRTRRSGPGPVRCPCALMAPHLSKWRCSSSDSSIGGKRPPRPHNSRDVRSRGVRRERWGLRRKQR